MVKIASYKLMDDLKKDGRGTRGILLYGPNRGLVDVLGESVAMWWLGEDGDKSGYLKRNTDSDEQEGWLNELEHATLFGNKRVVLLSGGNDKIGDFIKKHRAWERQHEQCLLIVKGQQLAKFSSLRKLFEEEKNLLAVGCYEDTERTKKIELEKILRLQLQGRSLSSEVKHYILSVLSSDSAYRARQLEKLELLMIADSTLLLEGVREVFEGVDALALDDMIDLVFGGQMGTNVAILDNFRGFQNIQSIPLLRASMIHAEKIQTFLRLLNDGRSFEDALSIVKPRLFFKREKAVATQCQIWTLARLREVIELLLQCERCMKTEPANLAKLSLERAMLNVARLATRR